MNNLRKLHLFLGCLFAPMLTFFILTGCLQVLHLHEDRKDGYIAPKILSALSEIHIHQRFAVEGSNIKPSIPLRIFILTMALGLLLTIGLGIFMAFKYTKSSVFVWLCLAAGFILPILFLWMALRTT